MIRWTAEAVEDFKGIRDYIAADNLPAAIQQCILISESIQQLDRFPRMGKAMIRGTVRQLAVAKTNYVVFYQLKRDTITLLGIPHGAMEVPPRFRK